ncbi:MAG: hypothetical protein JOY62_08760 [Acidobacteriaceae bacterium]|nr:hypothetical protein [Acidobacteriaceae bacterium]MBV9780051.1 hypothetical protein [Acidobacteriaceae bacterium]
MRKLLEVIVTSRDEAVEAELGGADRLEVVDSLENGGLTPPLEVVQKIVDAVSVPVRVMVRANASMSIDGPAETKRLKDCVRELCRFPIDGLVLGFIKDSAVDLTATTAVLAEAPACRVTFHRAFDRLAHPLRAIKELKTLPQVDRILTTGGEGPWAERKNRLIDWQRAAAPQIGLIVAAGLCPSILADVSQHCPLGEIHIGRAARTPQTTSGRVSRTQIASLKSLLG